MTQRIGQMRHRLQLQEPVNTPDDAGGNTVTWTNVADVWASLRPTSAGEVEQGDGIVSRITHEVVMRHRDGVTAAMRFIAGTRVFAIRSVVDPEETRVWLRCQVEEQTL